ncbi:MAG: glycoside hydrolase family 5 protein [Cyclobacteriaceae bacterium]
MKILLIKPLRTLQICSALALTALLLMSTMLLSCSGDEEVNPQDDDGGNTAQTAKEVILDMSDGFNLGNTFDNGLNSTLFSNIKPVIDIYQNAGMKHVRIPVTWMDRFTANDHLADANGNINLDNTRFKELVKVIDYALGLGMYVVINTHHEHWLKDHYDGSAQFDTKFETLWTGIANKFKDYDYHLIFEILNEPEGNLGEWGGSWPNPTTSQAISYTRKVNEVGYDAIRATGGNNATRIIMVGVNAQGNEAQIEEVYPSKSSLPGSGSDEYLAIQVHSYNPWSFCGHTGSNSAWPGSSTIENAIKKVGTHSVKLDVPVNYGEFGVGRQSNTAERNTDLVRGYYKTFAETTKSQNMSYSVWDDRGWFGLINSSGSSFTNNIVPSMLAQ